MSTETAAGGGPDRGPAPSNAGFAILGQRFDRPDILRRPAYEVLERFRAGGTGLILCSSDARAYESLSSSP